MSITVPGELAALLILVSVLAVWASLWWTIPKLIQDRRQYKLWQQRDLLSDQLRRGEISQSESALELLRMIEASAQTCSKTGPLNTVLLYMVGGREKWPWKEPDQRWEDKLVEHLNEYEHVLTKRGLMWLLPRQWVLQTSASYIINRDLFEGSQLVSTTN